MNQPNELGQLACAECGRTFWTDDNVPLCSEHFIGPGARP